MHIKPILYLWICGTNLPTQNIRLKIVCKELCYMAIYSWGTGECQYSVLDRNQFSCNLVLRIKILAILLLCCCAFLCILHSALRFQLFLFFMEICFWKYMRHTETCTYPLEMLSLLLLLSLVSMSHASTQWNKTHLLKEMKRNSVQVNINIDTN